MPTIDERIVQMEFDNKGFEKNVRQSIESLDALRESLSKLEQSSYSGVDKFSKSLNKADLSGIKKSIDDIGKHFTVVGRFIDRHVDGLIKSVEGKLKGVFKSVTFDQVETGFNKYATQTKAVQTITNATGKSVEQVEKVLDKLMRYTDETSYDFVTMAESIGKFTSAGVKLEKAELAMEGIANAAAVAGADKGKANRAMYNFAQALSMGRVKVQDWMSIENANMATKEFKEELIKTAIALGTITKTSDKAGKVIKGSGKKAKEVTINYKTFRDTLQEGWLTSDVLIKTLERYADTTTEIGKKSYEAAQKALTWEDAINAVKDAVSSQWMKSFKYLFGDLNESINLWTNFCNAIIEVTTAIGNWRNDLLAGWHELDGYNTMIEAASNVWSVFKNVLASVHDAFANIIPPLTSEKLVEITKYVRDVTAGWKEMFGYVEEQDEEIRRSSEEYDKLADKISKVKGETIIGDHGESVKEIQEILVSLGYLDKKFADGIFGKETQKAVVELKSALGVVKEGSGISVDTFDEPLKKALLVEGALYKVDKAVEKVRHKVGDVFEVEKEQLYTVNVANRLNTMLWKGRQNEQVRALQEQLIRLGYLDKGQADAIYGPKTEAAVKKLQKDLGVEVTGAWDKLTIRAARFSDMFEVEETRVETIEKTVGGQTTTMEKIHNIMRGFAAAINLVGTGFKIVGGIVGGVLKMLSPIGSTVLTIASAISTCLVSLDAFVNKNKIVEDVLKHIEESFLGPFIDGFKDLDETVSKFFAEHADISNFKKMFEALSEEFKKSEIGKKVEQWKVELNKFFVSAVPKIKAVGETLMKFKMNINGVLDDILKGKYNFKSFDRTWATIAARLALSNDSISKTIGTVMLKIRNWFRKTMPIVKSFGNAVKRSFTTNFTKALNWVKTNAPIASEKIQMFMGQIYEMAGVKIKSIIEWLMENGPKAFNWLKVNMFDRVKGAFGWFKTNGESIKQVIKDIAAAFGELIGFHWKNPEDLDHVLSLSERLENIKENISNFGDVIADKIKEIYENSPTLQKIWGIIEPIITKIQNFFGNLDTSVFTDFIATLEQSFNDFFNWSAKAEGEDGVDETALSPVEKLEKRMNTLMPIVDSFNKMVSTLSSAWNNGEVTLTSISNGISENGLLGTLFENIKNAIDKAKDFDYNIVAKAMFGVVSMYGIAKFASGISNIGKSFKIGAQGFSGLAGTLGSSISTFLGPNSIGDIIGNALKTSTDTLQAAIKQRPKDSVGTTMVKAAQSIAMIAVSLAGSLFLLSKIDIDSAKQGLVLFGVILGAMTGAMIALAKFAPNADKLGKGLMSMTGSIGILALSIWLMTQIVKGENPADLDKAMSVIWGFIWRLGLIELAIAKVSKRDGAVNIQGVLGMCAGVYVLVLAVKKMISVVKKNDAKDIDKAVSIVKSFLLRLGIIEAAIAFITRKSGKGGFKVSGILQMCAGVYILVSAINKVVKGIKKNPETYESGFNIVKSLLTELGVIEGALGFLNKGGIKISGVLQMCGGIYLLTLALNNVVEGINKYGDKYESAFNLLKSAMWTLSIAIKFIGGVVVSLGALPLIGGVKAILNLALFIGGLSALIALFEGIDGLTSGWLGDAINKFAYTFGTAIGTFIQQLKNPSGEKPEEGKSAIEMLEDLTNKLSGFFDTLMPFLEKVKAIKLDHVTGVGNLVGVILKMTGANFLDSLSGFASKAMNGGEGSGSGFVDMLNVLVDAVTPLTNLSNGLSGINVDNITSYGVPLFDAIKSLTDSMVAIAWDSVKDNVLSWLSGDKSIQTFVDDMVTICPNLLTFSIYAARIDPTPIGNVATVLENLGNAAKAVPKAGGYVQILIGEHDVGAFGSKLETLGSGIYKFYSKVKDIPADFKPNGTLKVLTSLVKLNNQIPASDGMLQAIVGEQNLATFGGRLETLASGLYKFYDGVKDIPADFTASGPIAVLQSLSDLESGLEAQGGKLHEWILGEKNLEEFGNQVSALGSNLFSFNVSTALVNTQKIKDIAAALADLATAVYSGGNGSFMATGMQAFQTAMYQLSDVIDWTPLIEVGHKVDENISTGVNENIASVETSIKTALGSCFTLVETSSKYFTGAVGGILAAMAKIIQNSISIKSAFGSMLIKATSTVRGAYNMLEAAGRYLDEGLAEGIRNGDYGVYDAAAYVARRAMEAVQNETDSRSPSRKFAELGMYFDLGLAQGLNQYSNMVYNASADVADGAINGAKYAVDSLSQMILDNMDDGPVIRPVLDLSEVQAGAAGMSGMFGTHTVGLRSSYIAGNIAQSRTTSKAAASKRASDTTDLGAAVESLNARIDELSNRISNMKVVTETGALIGQIESGMDKALGKRASRAKRGG